MSNSTPAFTLRIRLYRREHDPRLITITAFDDLVPGWDSAGRVRLTCEVRHGSEVIFPRDQLTCALHAASDGIQAKELVMSLVATKPGDTDRDYFDGYTPEQLAWVEAHGDALNMEREARYCDPETGEVRQPREGVVSDRAKALAAMSRQAITMEQIRQTEDRIADRFSCVLEPAADGKLHIVVINYWRRGEPQDRDTRIACRRALRVAKMPMGRYVGGEE